MKKVVLMRHGESTWNKENRFTGWTDVGLSEKGIEEAHNASKTLMENGFKFQMVYTSYLTRAIKTMNIILEDMDLLWLPVKKSWRLNEKHYGSLQGLNKVETAQKYGDEQVLLWRRSYDIPPQAMDMNDPRSPRLDPRYAEIPDAEIPLTESLKETIARAVPYWTSEIAPAMKQFDQILVVAHGNSLRGVLKYLKNIPEDEIVGINIPTGIPYVFEFADNGTFQKDYYIGDPEEIKKLMDAVANQAKGK